VRWLYSCTRVWCKVFDDRLAQLVLASPLLYSTNSITCGFGVLLIYKPPVHVCYFSFCVSQHYITMQRLATRSTQRITCKHTRIHHARIQWLARSHHICPLATQGDLRLWSPQWMCAIFTA